MLAVCGRSTLSPEQLREAGFKAVHALTDFESNVEKCMAEAGPLLEELGKHIGVHLPASAARTDTKENVHV
ncbi:glycerate kinase [Arthrobacter sp. Hiyo4]|nr:glycerate kinase [Arthrobacter sp. Hiyo4]